MNIKKFETEIYPFKVWVAISNQREEIFKKFCDYKNEEPLQDVPNTDVVYFVEELETNFYGVLMMFTDKSRFSHKTVTHETIHAASFLMECIGDSISGNESCAYLAGWIADCCEKAKCEIND